MAFANAPQELQDAFRLGEIDLQGQFMLGSNYTFLVNLLCAGQTLPAIYKPIRGERPLWDFPENSLAGREVAAYLVSQALGLELVPYTTLRADGPYGPGSLQQYIEYNPNYHYFNFRQADLQRLRPVALFDCLVNNADRKGSHVIIESDTRHLYAIDHGLCFHEEDKLRTVIWDFAEEALAPELLTALEALHAALTPGQSLSTALQAFLTPAELSALRARTQALLSGKHYPAPPSERRAYPYPPL